MRPSWYNPRMSDEGHENELDSSYEPGVGHVPVLGEAVMSLLAPSAGEVALDCTVGRGGHGAMMLPRLSPGGWYIGLDADEANARFANERLTEIAKEQQLDVRVDVVHRNFAAARSVLDELVRSNAEDRETASVRRVANENIVRAQAPRAQSPRVDVLLADLGFASNQMDDPTRGFSFRGDGPLDMRLDGSLTTTAADIINQWPERDLADVIFRYGEERLSRKIARKVVEVRKVEPILTTSRLADLVRGCYGGFAAKSRIDPATRTFMALRIAVNDELGVLERLLAAVPGLMKPGGRVGIISFHSLEDRLVKRAMQGWHAQELAERVTKKPAIADEAEIANNPRSRSAKLRVARWLTHPGGSNTRVSDHQ